MRIFCPFTHLRSETYVALKDYPVTFLPLIDHASDYWRHFHERWKEGETFINVEHDVVPLVGVLQELWDCPEPYCISGYTYPYHSDPPRQDMAHLGCAKLSRELIASCPEIYRVGPIDFRMVEHYLINATLNKYHFHGFRATHLHPDPTWPTDAFRKFNTFENPHYKTT
jgi:hypothetical protein